MKNVLELRFRLRAEELRAVAGEMSVEENRAALLRTADDYERLAQSAEILDISKQRLANLNARSADTLLHAACVETPAAITPQVDDQVQIYRDMAADAVALADVDNRSRRGWLSLARTWTELAEKLEETARADASKQRADAP
jgi:chromatin segregation and condensation protein Rec8/ScpA/Scc1 (kleisin family)